jgi:tetratricopeptide (TPR) repeat protein
LRAVKPNSKLLFNDQKIKRTTELSHEEYKELKQDIDRWECIVNEKDAALSGMDDQFTDKGADLPPIRDPNSIDTASRDKVTSGSRGNPNPSRIKSTDFNKWDKFVTRESEEEETDKNRKSKSNPSPATVINDQLSDKEMKLSNLEKEQQAIREKEKGNEAFRAGDYEEALGYYTRSISLFPTIAAHNNKAIVFIKLGRYDNAIVCCNRALEMEPNNVKGLMRRAESYQLLKQFKAAADDLQVVLKLEPDNKRAQQLLQKVEKDLPKQEKKGKRIAIQDVTEEEGNKKDSDIPINAAPAAQPCPQPLPSNIQKMKDEGNELFRAGQYGSAVTFYNKCIASLEKTSGDHAHSIATILSNRAACHLKNGDCRSCIDDASRSIELLPINLKSFIRRGQAYETLEKYKQAYNDYQVALRIDGRVDNIRNASSRY